MITEPVEAWRFGLDLHARRLFEVNRFRSGNSFVARLHRFALDRARQPAVKERTDNLQ